MRSSSRLGALGSLGLFAGVIGRRGVRPLTEGLREKSACREAGSARPGPLGVPIGVAREDGRGMFGGRGVAEYCARSALRLGEPERPLEARS